MKITVTAASRRDEIIQRKADYEARKSAYDNAMEQTHQSYRAAKDAALEPLEQTIRDALGVDIGDLYIRCDTRYDGCIEVEIGNDNGSPRRTENASLTWRWSATLIDGEVQKESSSWSGLNATTLGQIEDLKLSVRQLEIINNLDWENLLAISLPEYKDFVDTSIEYPGSRPDFEDELLEADIEDIVGQRVLVETGEGRNYYTDVYVGIVRDSGSQYTVFEIPAREVEDIQNGKPVPTWNRQGEITTLDELVERYSKYTYRVRKTNFFSNLIKPLVEVSY